MIKNVYDNGIHFTGGSNGGVIGLSKEGLSKTELRSRPDSFGVDAVSSQAPTHSKKRSFHDINDITKGAEKVRISLVDEIGSDGLPKFFYIPENTIYQNAYLHFSLARISDEDCCSSCSDDCLSSRVPCACARETGGEFAYSPRGLLRKDFLNTCISMSREPQKHHYFYCEDCPLERSKSKYFTESCKGHLVRKFIKECWRKCGCGMYCGNRVVQRGITCKLQVVFFFSLTVLYLLLNLKILPDTKQSCIEIFLNILVLHNLHIESVMFK